MGKAYGSKECRIEFNSSGFKALLMSREMLDAVYSAARNMAETAGDGFSARTFYATRAGRVMATVDADTDEARKAEATQKALSRAAASYQGVITK